ncbi:MAG: TPM domain-containing protein, partial [Flavobacteriaceae bacterium]|nr:TPM domain-containing protein [Flavobacteriaceae bacterium]
MSKIEKFLTKQEELDIIAAIKQAESQTSGEIRVHIEDSSKIDAFDRALELFHELKMDNTRLQNAVLIYIAVKDRTFVIYGDKGINDIVKEDFWDSTRDVMQKHFKAGEFKQGIVEGVLKAGEQLQKHFPYLDG